MKLWNLELESAVKELRLQHVADGIAFGTSTEISSSGSQYFAVSDQGGLVSIYQVGMWILVKTLKIRESGIVTVAVHLTPGWGGARTGADRPSFRGLVLGFIDAEARN